MLLALSEIWFVSSDDLSCSPVVCRRGLSSSVEQESIYWVPWVYGNNTFVHRASFPIVAEHNDIHQEKLEGLSAMTLRAIMSDRHFETDSGGPQVKPVYFFGDFINKNDDFMFGGEEIWLHMIDKCTYFFLECRGHMSSLISSPSLLPGR